MRGFNGLDEAVRLPAERVESWQVLLHCFGTMIRVAFLNAFDPFDCLVVRGMSVHQEADVVGLAPSPTVPFRNVRRDRLRDMTELLPGSYNSYLPKVSEK